MTSGAGVSRGFNHSSHRGSSQAPFLHSGFNNHGSHNGGVHNRGFHNHGFHNRRFQSFGFRNNCFGAGCWSWGAGYPWWGANYYPWWWDEQDRQFDEDYYRQYEIANEMNRQSLEEQRLRRQEEADGDQDSYAPQSSVRRSAPDHARESQADAVVPATVLVFRDQHREEVSNYAIVGQTLWSFASQRTKKISLADLDLAATEKANDERGVTFRVPGANEGQ